MPKDNSKAARQVRREDAEEREIRRAGRTDAQQIAALDKRGADARKERKRLSA